MINTASDHFFLASEQLTQRPIPESNVVQIDADFASAIGWLGAQRSSRSRDLGPHTSSGMKAAAHPLHHSLNELKLGSAVLWIESDSSLVAFNENAKRWLGIESSVLAERFEFRLNRNASRLSELSDQMLQIGTATVQYEFEGSATNGDWYRWAIRKTRLPGLLLNGFGCLYVARPVAIATPNEISSEVILEEQLLLYESLDKIDQAICQGVALGDSTSEIACEVGLTRRSIEVRRLKILEVFGFSRQVQIVRMMVRFEENGCFGT